ncbi:MAG: PorT family protein [Tannerellaceae bacterium]|nr:PorT family protein [Tannerellaceae bacterium]
MKMKKIVGLVLVSIFALLAVPADAQIRFGVKGGVNISKIHFSGDEYLNDIKSSTGFQVGPMMEIGVPYTGFGIEAALLYSQMGYEWKDKSYSSDYLDIPLLLKWKMNLPLVPVKPYLGFGPDFSFRVGKPKELKEEFDTKGFGVGLNIGAGVEVLKHLQIGFNYNFGLTDDLSSDDVDLIDFSGKRRNWAITAAILF